MINKQSTLLERVEFDPNKRASARQIQELFRKALEEVNDS